MTTRIHDTRIASAIAFLLLFAANNLAQPGIVVYQKQVIADNTILAGRLAGLNFEDTDGLAAYVLDMPFETLVESVRKHDGHVQEMTFYLDRGRFRMDMLSPMGKMSMIVHNDEDKIYMLLWDAKKYTEMSLSQIREMRRGVMQDMSTMQQTMPDMARILEQLPPEARQKAIEAMENARKMQASQPEAKTDIEKPKAEPTGRKKTINGFVCEEWLLKQDHRVIALWLTRSQAKLAGQVKQFGESVSNGFGMENEKAQSDLEIWTLVPGAIPIEARTFEAKGYSGFEVEGHRITKIEQRNFDPAFFEVPTGFQPGSMFDMMNLQRSP